jgi:hypothetical protein
MARYHALFLFAALTLFVNQAFGSWPGHELEHCRKHPENYKKIQDFTTEWFMNKDNLLDHVKARYEHTSGYFDNALFYTRTMSDIARKYACQENRITIWEPWHPALYNDSDHHTNVYSCIHYDQTARNYFYGNMSEAFARLSTGHAVVMHRSDDYAKPPEDGIWARVEKKAIVEMRTTLQRVYKLNETKKSTLVAIWDATVGSIFGKAEDPITLLRQIGESFLALLPEQNELRRRRGSRVSLRKGAYKEDQVPACQQSLRYSLPIDW